MARSRRRRRSRQSSGISTQTWLLIGLGGYLWYSGALNAWLRPASVPSVGVLPQDQTAGP